MDQPQAAFDTLWFQCRYLSDEIYALKEKLNTNPQNSSLPPSTTQPFKRKSQSKTEKKWWGKKPGAVIGHVGHGRQLLPLDQVHETITCYPTEECVVCGSTVKALDIYSRKQICDLPHGKLHVTEYQLHRGQCTGCKHRCCASLPEGVSNKLLGHFALAKIGLITGKYHLSKRLAVQLLFDFFALKISVGAVSNAEAVVTAALAKPVEAIEKEVKAAERLNADETSHFLNHKLQWLWVAVSKQATWFKIFPKRDAASAKQLIGDSYSGLVNTDRFGSYNWLSEDQHQYCWAHLIRDFRKISERENPKEGYVGCVLLSEAQSIIHYWNKLQTSGDEKIKIMCRSFLQEYPHRLKQTLDRGTALVGTKTSKFCRQVLKHWDCLWHFLNKPNVEPTNNAAERALRQAVIWRKLSFGTQSKRGQLFVERILSVVETCRQRDAPVLAFIENTLVQSR